MDKTFNTLRPERLRLRWLLLFAVALVLTLAVTQVGLLEVSAADADSSDRAEKSSTKDKKIPKAESRFTTLDGARIHYVNYGKGDEALVLIHGWTRTWIAGAIRYRRSPRGTG